MSQKTLFIVQFNHCFMKWHLFGMLVLLVSWVTIVDSWDGGLTDTIHQGAEGR